MGGSFLSMVMLILVVFAVVVMGGICTVCVSAVHAGVVMGSICTLRIIADALGVAEGFLMALADHLCSFLRCDSIRENCGLHMGFPSKGIHTCVFQLHLTEVAAGT